MKNTGLLKLLALVPLMLWSCSKTGFIAEEASLPETVQDPWTVIPLEATPATGGPATLTADSAETKSQLVVSGSSAKVIWTAGDSFLMYGYNDGDKTANRTTYNTAAGGDVANFYSTSAIVAGKQHYYSFYPASASSTWGQYGTGSDKEFIIGFEFPRNQVAKPGKLAEGANLSFASGKPWHRPSFALTHK